MTEKRTITVNGTDFTLPKLWGDSEVIDLLAEFEGAEGAWVIITLDDGVLRVLANETTQVMVTTRTIKPRVAQVLG